MLLNDELAPHEIEEWFLQDFSVVVEPHWKLLSPYINPNVVPGLGAKEETAINPLQIWREQMPSTYLLPLVEIWNEVYTQYLEPYWKRLSPYMNPTAVPGPGAKEETAIFYQLRRWREQMHPTYGDLMEILSRLYIQPLLPDAKTQDVPCDDINGTF